MKEFLNAYPTPIASIISKYYKLPVDKLYDRHSVLCDLYESTVKLISIIAIKEGLIIDKFIKQRFPKGMDFLKHPALGHWVSIIRAFCEDNHEYPASFLKEIRDWYKSEKPSNEILQSFKMLPEITFPKGKPAVEGIIDSLVTYRNKVWKGHGAVIVNEKSLLGRVDALEKIIHFILQEATFLRELNLFYTSEVKKTGDNGFEASATSLKGIDGSSANYVFDSPDPYEIYAAYSSERSLSKTPVKLSPLLEYQRNNKDELQIYYFNDAKKTKLEYLCYYDGSFYYHKEINKELEEVFNIRLEKGYDTEAHFINTLPEDERKQKSNYFLEKGTELHKKGNYEGAIIAFEDALEWHRNSDAIILMCKSMLANEEDKTYVLNILENAFEMDPSNAKAKQLKERIESGKHIEEESEEHLSYFDVILPDPWRKFPMISYAVILLVLFGAGASILILSDPANTLTHAVFSVLCLAQSIILYVGLTASRKNFLDSYFPLLRQQANMNIDKFKVWYETRFNRIFGHFARLTDSSLQKKLFSGKLSWSWKPALEQEKLFFGLSGAFVIIFSLNQINIQVLYDKSMVVAVVRFMQTALMWMFLPPVLRYLIVSTFFIKDYSQKELKPVVSSVKDNGFTALSGIFINSLMIFIIFYLSVLTAYLIVARGPFYMDVLGLAFGFFIGGFWLIYTPLYIKRSMVLSKSMVLSDYNDHVNKAFEKFIKNPDESNLEKVKWLKNQESIVAEISTRLFSFKNWLLYLFFMIIFVAASIFYVLIRFDLFSVPFFNLF